MIAETRKEWWGCENRGWPTVREKSGADGVRGVQGRTRANGIANIKEGGSGDD
jgi:hypothetical protein